MSCTVQFPLVRCGGLCKDMRDAASMVLAESLTESALAGG
jgi:hypothetical protein